MHNCFIRVAKSKLIRRAVIEYRVHKRVKEQFDAFMSGFSELIPQDLINVFDERELEVCEYRIEALHTQIFLFSY